MKRMLLPLAVLFALSASPAAASTTFGVLPVGPIGTTPSACTIQGGTTSTSCTVFANNGSPEIDAPGGFAAPFAGVITSWQITTGTSGSIDSMTFALRTVSGSGTYLIGQRGAAHAVASAGGDLSFPERMSIGAGGKLGLDVQLTGSPGAAPYFYHSAGTLEQYTAPYAVSPAFGVNETFSPGGGLPYYYRISLRANLEADADGDGFGDESQDQCPQRADVQAACPPPVISALAVSKRTLKLSFKSDIPGAGTGFVTKKTNGQLAGKKRLAAAKTTYKPVKTIAFPVVAGKNSVDHKKKVGAKKLKPGSYRVKLQVVSAQNTVATKTVSFTIKKPKKKR